MRFPLYAKILLWFFLNLIALAVPAWLIFGAQFRPGLDSLLAGRAGDHVQAVADLITEELRASDKGKWDGVLKRFSDVYHVKFYVFENGGAQTAGGKITLPPAVHTRLVERPLNQQQQQPNPPPPREPAPFDDEQTGPPPPAAGPPGSDEAPPSPPQVAPASPVNNGANPPPAPRAGPHPKSMVHTTNPSRYWVFIRIPGPRPNPASPPIPSTLIVESETINGGGLFFDPVPWFEIAAGAIIISALIWLPFVRGITGSITRMTRATGQIAEGRFEVRVEGRRRRDELGSLADSINRMAERLAGFVGGQKRFLGDIAHELCSPLARAQMALGVLDQRGDEAQRAYVTDVREEIELMSSLVNELLSFSKASLGMQIKVQPVALRPLIKNILEREATSDTNVTFAMEGDLRVMAEPELLQRSIANLVRNALHYAGHAGPIKILATAHQDKVSIAVTDSGPGVPVDALSQVFDPFYRVDPSRARETGGVGLGLAIVKTCVESCGGTVTAHNREPSGLEVVITLRSA